MEPATPALAKRIALYLTINERVLPGRYHAAVDDAGQVLPEDLPDEEALEPATPYSYWPEDHWTFTVHFASTDSFKGFLWRFERRGYALDSTMDGMSLSRMFGSLKVTFQARLYPGDEEGFLRGEQAQKFLASVKKDLRDPSVQGVILRTHAQFNLSNLFDRRVTKGKLILDGACRSGWVVRHMRRVCPTCSFVVNTGTGKSELSQPAIVAVVEGLARHESWKEIGEEWRRVMSNDSVRMLGPWNPPFDEALSALRKSERAAKKGALPE